MNYGNLSDSTLIQMYVSYKQDYRRAREHDDAQAMAYYENKLVEIEHALCQKGV